MKRRVERCKSLWCNGRSKRCFQLLAPNSCGKVASEFCAMSMVWEPAKSALSNQTTYTVGQISPKSMLQLTLPSGNRAWQCKPSSYKNPQLDWTFLHSYSPFIYDGSSIQHACFFGIVGNLSHCLTRPAPVKRQWVLQWNDDHLCSSEWCLDQPMENTSMFIRSCVFRWSKAGRWLPRCSLRHEER